MSTLGYGNVPYGRYSTVDTLRYGTVTLRYRTLRTIPYGTVPYGTVPYRTVPYGTRRLNLHARVLDI